MTRAGAIVLNNGCVALIKRVRNGQQYYLYPGGYVEENETLTEAVIREVKEELGLEIAIEKLVAEIIYRGNFQYYFLVEIVGGEFGTGTGPEYQGEYSAEKGTYTPVWMEISELLDQPVYPQSISAIIVQSVKQGWPTDVCRSVDQGR